MGECGAVLYLCGMAATVGLHWLWTESGLLLLLLAGRTGEHFMKIAKVGWGAVGGEQSLGAPARAALL